MILNLKIRLFLHKAKLKANLYLVLPGQREMVWVAGESSRAFLFNEVSSQDLHRFMGEMILTALKNGAAWAGEIEEGRLDSRCKGENLR